MLNEQIITDYLLGLLPEAERVVFEQRLAVDPLLRKEVEELQAVWQALQRTEADTDKDMDDAFYKALQGEKMLESTVIAFKPTPWKSYLRYAAAVAGLGLTFWVGRQTAPVEIQYRTVAVQTPSEVPQKTKAETQTSTELPMELANVSKSSNPNMMQEIASLRKEMKMTQELVILGLLKDHSASERLKGINYAAALNDPKPAVIQALINTLRDDESLNVRLSTIETLERFKPTDEVKKVLVSQLTQTSEPTEQTTLIETLVRMRVRESLPVFDKLQKDTNVDESVRALAKSSMNELTMLTE
ncbi:HEAT repeat domain-containing protein [Runella sp. SP2]|uniref:HEAT repeat domain-containing protein n=1 Tax=Runella sp. SP2 TaxID=2268026 RepID=UPI000F0802B2|nr:HEAT repeat domain-containing protein [Runella sp. SP2]AYQ34326.1 hypothetical protein DTQ70_20145 [Runella sp. SP2]